MNKEYYLKIKKDKIDKRTKRSSCTKCLRPQKACFCNNLTPFETNAKFVILMHPMEAKPSQVGTGRLTHLALLNSELIIGTGLDENNRFNKLINDPNYLPVVLYPGKNAIELEQINKDEISSLTEKKLMIFVIDATWPCAKTMMKNTTKLHNLPKLCFETKHESQFAIKHQPAKYCLSTIESVVHLLEQLENFKLEPLHPQKNSMLLALNKMVEFHKACASDPSLNNYQRTARPTKEASQRIPSKKWETRRICYDI